MSSLSTYVVTFNCGRELIKPAVFATHLFDVASSPPDLVVLCLQEIAPIGYAFLARSLLSPYYNAFRDAVKLADGAYVDVVAENVGLTAIMVFARAEIASNIKSLQTAGVGVGFAETGNKGAVGVRLGYDVGDDLMLLTFVSAHLSPFEGGLARRNLDYQHIVQRLVFTDHSRRAGDTQGEDQPLLKAGGEADNTTAGLYLPSSHLVFAGDLNYRTSLLPPSPADWNSYPQPTQDRSDPTHFSHLLLDDQLTLELKSNRTLQHLVEEPINFAPTYKLRPRQDVTLDSDQAWNWALHRWPSWCDRILRSPSKIKSLAYNSLPLFGSSDHRPVALSIAIPLKAVDNAYPDFAAPYEIDPTWKARRQAARTREVAVGTLAYLTWTYQGNAVLLATVIACTSAWLIFRALVLLP
ncbi:hypothetical protein DV735_g4488, partial [Chaetothyriales sp. CBS 134920]